MSSDPDAVTDAVTDDAANSRFLIRQDGSEAELVYRRNGRRLVLVHTGVPEEIGGRGVGGRLVGAAVERARADGLTLVPVCPYAARWLESHPDEVGSVPVDWSSSEAEGQEPQ